MRSSRREVSPDEIAKRLINRAKEVQRRIEENKLPGADEFVAANPKARSFISEHRSRAERALRDRNEVNLEDALAQLVRGWNHVNVTLAEEHRGERGEPETWDLRYVKWMKLEYIRFDSPRGEFYLYPRKPRRSPKVDRWYTVDEMLNMLKPGVTAAIKIFDVLPCRPERLPGPERGERFLHVDMSGDEFSVKAERRKT